MRAIYFGAIGLADRGLPDATMSGIAPQMPYDRSGLQANSNPTRGINFSMSNKVPFVCGILFFEWQTYGTTKLWCSQ